jgi:hypothetical protein
MSKHTNRSIKDIACIYTVRILQHPTFRPTPNSTQTTMVNALDMHFSPLSASVYGTSTNWSTQQRHQGNEGKSILDAARVRVLGALQRVQSKMVLAAKT